jgi:hypothetical protein
MSAPAYADNFDVEPVLYKYSIPSPGRAGEEAPFGTLLELASDLLDDHLGPFVGTRFSPTQLRQFPRSVTLPGDEVNATPLAVKEWVVITAHQLKTGDPTAPVTGESVGVISVSYAKAEYPRLEKIKDALISRYQEKVALRI